MLIPDSSAASLVSNIGSSDSNYAKDSLSVESFDQHTTQELEEPKDAMQFYPPSGAVK